MNQLKHLKVILLLIFIILIFITVFSIRRSETDSGALENDLPGLSSKTSEHNISGNIVNEITDGKRELVSNGKVFAVVNFEKCIESSEGQVIFIQPDIDLKQYNSHFSSEKAVKNGSRIELSGNISFFNNENNLRMILSEPVTFQNNVIKGKKKIKVIFNNGFVLTGKDFSLDLDRSLLIVKDNTHFDNSANHFRITSKQSFIDYRIKNFVFLKNVFLTKEKSEFSEKMSVQSITACYNPESNYLKMTGFVNLMVSLLNIKSVECDIYPDNEQISIQCSKPVFCETEHAIFVSDSMSGNQTEMDFSNTIFTDGFNQLSVGNFQVNMEKRRGAGKYPYFLNKDFNLYGEHIDINMDSNSIKILKPFLYSAKNGVFLEGNLGFIDEKGHSELQGNVKGCSTTFDFHSDSLTKIQNQLQLKNCTVANQIDDIDLIANKALIENNQIKAFGDVIVVDKGQQITINSEYADFRKRAMFFSGDVHIVQASNSIVCNTYLRENGINIFSMAVIDYNSGMNGSAGVIVQNPYSDFTRFYRNVELFDIKGNLAKGDCLTLNKATDKIQLSGKTNKAKAEFFYGK